MGCEWLSGRILDILAILETRRIWQDGLSRFTLFIKEKPRAEAKSCAVKAAR